MYLMDKDGEKDIKKSIERKISSTGFSWKQVLFGIFIGLLLFASLRVVTYKPEHQTHYHANFAVFIDGQQEKFESPFYYEEITACDLNAEANPAHRTHMHDNKAGLVHVHADAVTWGNFFQNIGWNIGEGYIDTSKKLYVNDAFKKVTFILNGETVDEITNKVIGNTDKLLVSFGDEKIDTIKQQTNSIPSSAADANNTQDPASCSGDSHQTKFNDRLKNIF